MKRCAFCDEFTQWLWCKDGARRLFDGAPNPVEQVPAGRAWVATRARVKGRERVVMTRLVHVGKAKAAAVRHVVVLHDCPYRRQLVARVFGDPQP